MSHPILYNPDEKNFKHLGLGVLAETISCIVTEERNGIFELNMEYPITGLLFTSIRNDCLIKADAGHKLKRQLFRIKRLDISMKGVMKIHATHISYHTQDLALRPQVHIYNSTALTALTTWQSSIIGEHPFTTKSDIGQLGDAYIPITDTPNARAALSSILDVWGGEFLFDNYNISLLRSRGENANTILAYGRNLTDLQQEKNISNTFTSIYPFAIFREDDIEKIITIPNFIVDSEYVNAYPHRRVLVVDFTAEFEQGEQVTAARLLELANRYIEDNNVGIPRVSLSVGFVDLSKSLDQTDAKYEEINLCDTVPIYFEKLGIMTRAQIVRIEWDVLLDQYSILEIGEIKESFSNHINNIEASLNSNNRNQSLDLTYVRNELAQQINNVRLTAERADNNTAALSSNHTELRSKVATLQSEIISLAERVETLEREGSA